MLVKHQRKGYRRKGSHALGQSREFKTLVGSIQRKKEITRGLSPYSDLFEHHFVRQLDDATIFANAGGTLIAQTSVAGTPPWIAFGTQSADVGISGVVQQAIAMQFTMAYMPSVSDFVNLFHDYKINKLVLRFTTNCGDSYNPGQGLPTFYTVIDPHDSVAPSTFSQIQNYASVEEWQASQDRPFVRSFKPQPAMANFVSIASTGYGYPGGKSQWLDLQNGGTNIIHYGVKGWIRNFVNANNSGLSIRIQPTVYFSVRRPR